MARYIDSPETAAKWVIEDWAGGKPFTETMLARNLNSDLGSIRSIFKNYVYYHWWSDQLELKDDMTIAQLREELRKKWDAAFEDASST